MHGRALRPELIYSTPYNFIRIIDWTGRDPHIERLEQRNLEAHCLVTLRPRVLNQPAAT